MTLIAACVLHAEVAVCFDSESSAVKRHCKGKVSITITPSSRKHFPKTPVFLCMIKFFAMGIGQNAVFILSSLDFFFTSAQNANNFFKISLAFVHKCKRPFSFFVKPSSEHFCCVNVSFSKYHEIRQY